jgi:hypothetical protein
MSVLNRPPVNPTASDRSPDDVDGVLNDFFRAELPDPWPALTLPAEPPLPLPPSRRRPLVRGRFALAASLLLLLLGSLALSNRFPDQLAYRVESGSGQFDSAKRKPMAGPSAAGGKVAKKATETGR